MLYCTFFISSDYVAWSAAIIFIPNNIISNELSMCKSSFMIPLIISCSAFSSGSVVSES